MAITTMDQLVAGLLPYGEDVLKVAFTAEAVGVQHTSLYLGGRPGGAAAPTPGLAGAALTSYPGAIPVPAAVGGKNIHLARLEFSQTANIGGASVVDRLWHNSGISPTTTTAQTINSPTLPPRDSNGTTNGYGVMLALEVTTTFSNSSASTSITVSYTNDQGVSGRTATISSSNPFPATALQHTWVPLALQAGDTGVRSVQSITLGATLTSGVMSLVMFREIVAIGTPVTNTVFSAGPIELGLPRIYDNSVLHFVYNMTNTSGGAVNAQLTYAQG